MGDTSEWTGPHTTRLELQKRVHRGLHQKQVLTPDDYRIG
jgi:hypothetical protein